MPIIHIIAGYVNGFSDYGQIRFGNIISNLIYVGSVLGFEVSAWPRFSEPDMIGRYEGNSQGPSDLQTQHIGELMPGFRLPLLNGGERNLDELLTGRRGALLVFWSGSCAHCVRYDAFFNQFEARHPDLGFAAIASRINETSGQMISATLDRGLTFPILRDQGARIARLWFSQQTPRCYLLDPGGRLLYRGAIDNFRLPTDPEYVEYLEPAIAQFLKGEPIARADTPSFGCAIETVYYQLPKQL